MMDTVVTLAFFALQVLWPGAVYKVGSLKSHGQECNARFFVLAGAVAQEQCTMHEAGALFQDADELSLLLEACPNNDARWVGTLACVRACVRVCVCVCVCVWASARPPCLPPLCCMPT